MNGSQTWFVRGAAPLALSRRLACLAARAADLDLFSADTLSLTGDLRLVGVNGEESWVDGGFGKLATSGADGDFAFRRSSAMSTWSGSRV